jgi:hypothetical protein
LTSETPPPNRARRRWNPRAYGLAAEQVVLPSASDGLLGRRERTACMRWRLHDCILHTRTGMVALHEPDQPCSYDDPECARHHHTRSRNQEKSSDAHARPPRTCWSPSSRVYTPNAPPLVAPPLTAVDLEPRRHAPDANGGRHDQVGCYPPIMAFVQRRDQRAPVPLECCQGAPQKSAELIARSPACSLQSAPKRHGGSHHRRQHSVNRCARLSL